MKRVIGGVVTTITAISGNRFLNEMYSGTPDLPTGIVMTLGAVSLMCCSSALGTEIPIITSEANNVVEIPTDI